MKPSLIGLAGAAAIALVAAGGAGMAQAANASSLPAPQVDSAGPAATAQGRAATLLYNQDNDACLCGVSSTDYGIAADNALGADDFTVPTGKTWTITQVKVTQGPKSGTAASFTVFFARNAVNTKKQDVPGALVKKQTLKGKIDTTNGSVVIAGITGVKLTAGHYWLSVQGNGLPKSAPSWYWATRTVQSGSPGVWENPGNGSGTGCTKWTPTPTCFPGVGPDWMFALYGSG
jgi:hypothetical protein